MTVDLDDVEAWNDKFAAEHDIDEYYSEANVFIRFIESRRLRMIQQMVGSATDANLLEVGCGGGHILALFPRANRVGVDPSGAMLAKAADRLKGESVRLLRGQLNELELEPATFDYVICTEVLEHVVDPSAVLADIRPLLRPGGTAVITLPNDRLIEMLKNAMRRSGLALLPGLRRLSWGGDQYHLHSWRIAEMRQLLSAEFEIAAEGWAPARLLPVRCCFGCRPRSRAAGSGPKPELSETTP